VAAITTELREQIAAFPKVELHRHLEGAIRLSTLVEIAKDYKIDLPTYSLEELRPYVQITADSPADAGHFLSKFNILRHFYCAPEVIQRLAREVVEDAAADNVKYMELRFTPKALAKSMNFQFSEVIRWVCQGIDEAQRSNDIKVRLIVSMNRHESVREGERIMQSVFDMRDRGIVGIDLAGQEAGYPANPFFQLFGKARDAGLGITVHGGEWSGPKNVRDAIELMGATRIGHGVRVIEDSKVAQLARERGTTFEVCPTSNVQSGSVPSFAYHPLRDMLYLGLKATLNTDDPSISNITLTDEFVLAMEHLAVTLDEVKKMIVNAARATFLPEAERAALVTYFTESFLPVEQKE
jgi:adenosine deaminase